MERGEKITKTAHDDHDKDDNVKIRIAGAQNNNNNNNDTCSSSNNNSLVLFLLYF